MPPSITHRRVEGAEEVDTEDARKDEEDGGKELRFELVAASLSDEVTAAATGLCVDVVNVSGGMKAQSACGGIYCRSCPLTSLVIE